jgi:hypothetical protein
MTHAGVLFVCLLYTFQKAQEIFDQNIISHERLSSDPNMLFTPQQLAVRLKGK